MNLIIKISKILFLLVFISIIQSCGTNNVSTRLVIEQFYKVKASDLFSTVFDSTEIKSFNGDRREVAERIINGLGIEPGADLQPLLESLKLDKHYSSVRQDAIIYEAKKYENLSRPTVLSKPFVTKLKITDNIPYIELEFNEKKYSFAINTALEFSFVVDNQELRDAESKFSRYVYKDENGLYRRATLNNVTFETASGNLILEYLNISKEDYGIKKRFGILKKEFDGEIGWSFLRNYKVTLDYKNGIFTLENSPNNLEREYNLFSFGLPIIVDIQDSNNLKYHYLSTGLRGSRFYDNDESKSYSQVRYLKYLSGKIIEQKTRIVPLTIFQFGNYELNVKNIEIELFRSDKPKLGVIASEFFKNGKIVIDNKNGIFEYSY